MLPNHKKHVGSPCRWLPFLGNRLLPWSIRREENFVMEKRLHLESGTGIMEHFHTFSSFWKYFFNKRSCSCTYPFRPDKWLLPPFPSAPEPTFFFKRGEGVCTQPSLACLAWGLSNCFDLCVNCLLPLPLMKILSTHAVCQIWANFYFYFWGGEGVLNFRVWYKI